MSSSHLIEHARRGRVDALTQIFHAGSGHPGGSLSVMDLLTFLMFEAMDGGPEDADRDRLILSKGHACPALYALGAQRGWIDPAEQLRLRKLNGLLQGHTHVGATPWVEASTGSLGQGFSTALGMAVGLRHQGIQAHVYAVLGDGELQEGEVWEAAMFAAHHGVTDLCAVVDYNKMQSDDLNENIMGLEPLVEKWEAFGWRAIRLDGHNFDKIHGGVNAFRHEEKRPTVLIADTIKGQGVSYMAGVPTWHGSVKLTPDNLRDALRDLGVEETEIEARITGEIWEAA